MSDIQGQNGLIDQKINQFLYCPLNTYKIHGSNVELFITRMKMKFQIKYPTKSVMVKLSKKIYE